jgi:hypothetical protein
MNHEEIRRALMSGCTEETLRSIRCPICGGDTTFLVHPRGKGFVIRCDADTSHMHMTAANLSPPDWWKKYISEGWMS